MNLPLPLVPDSPGGAGGASGGSGGGAGGGAVDVLSNLPDGTGPVATIIILALVVLSGLVPLAGRVFPDRKTTPAASASSEQAVSRGDVDVLRDHIARVERELAEARTETAAIRVKYEAEAEANHDLQMQLAAAERRLERAQEELTQLNAKLMMVVGGSWGRPYVVPPPPPPYPAQQQPGQQPGPPARRSPPRHQPQPDPDEATTDPIPGARQ